MVTRSRGNVLYELDGQPALPLYKRYLCDQASGLPATGLLFPLARILARDPLGTVAVLPSDHYLADTRPLVDALVRPVRDRLALVGVTPTGPELEYGWIVKSHRLGNHTAYGVARRGTTTSSLSFFFVSLRMAWLMSRRADQSRSR